MSGLKKLLIGGLIVAVCIGFVLAFINRADGRWSCQNGQWMKYNNPDYPKPLVSCDKKITLPKDKESCLQVGGVWRKIGPEPFESCNRKAVDRGNICKDNSECEGLCQAGLTREELQEGMRGKSFKGKGQCSVWLIEVGCFGMVQNGKVQTICID